METLEVEHVLHIAWKSCLRKKNLTEEVANKIVDRALEQGELVYFYKCPMCSSFHITTSEPLPEDRIRIKFL